MNVKRKLKEDPEFGEDIYNDNNKFGQALLLRYIMNTLYLIILIFNVSYLVGMLWMKYIFTAKYIFKNILGT